MKKTILLFLLGSSMFLLVDAQSFTPDPTLSEKTQKEILKTNKQLADRKLELLKLEGKLRDAQEKVDKTQKAAQTSADENANAASRLNEDALDKSKARKARKKASQAASDAKNARKAVDDLEKLNKNIGSLKKKITEDEKKLQKYHVIPAGGKSS